MRLSGKVSIHPFVKALVSAGRFPSVSAVLQVLLQQRANGAFLFGDLLRQIGWLAPERLALSAAGLLCRVR